MSCFTHLCGKWLHPPGGTPRRRRSGACRLRRRRLAALLSSAVASAIGVATLCALLLPGLAPGVSAAEPAATAATAATPVTSTVPQGQGPGPAVSRYRPGRPHRDTGLGQPSHPGTRRQRDGHQQRCGPPCRAEIPRSHGRPPFRPRLRHRPPPAGPRLGGSGGGFDLRARLR